MTRKEWVEFLAIGTVGVGGLFFIYLFMIFSVVNNPHWISAVTIMELMAKQQTIIYYF